MFFYEYNKGYEITLVNGVETKTAGLTWLTRVFTNKNELLEALNTHHFENKNLLMMSSGTFDKTNLKDLATSLLH